MQEDDDGPTGRSRRTMATEVSARRVVSRSQVLWLRLDDFFASAEDGLPAAASLSNAPHVPRIHATYIGARIGIEFGYLFF